MIAENEVVLTYLLQLMSERGILDKLAFKGGTCLRKMFTGSGGRFSTDLDFTRVEEHDHEDVILAMCAMTIKLFPEPTGKQGVTEGEGSNMTIKLLPGRVPHSRQGKDL